MITECLNCSFWRRTPCAPEPEDAIEDERAQNTRISSVYEERMDADGQNVEPDTAPKTKRYRHKRKGRHTKFRRRSKSVKTHEKYFFEQGHSVYVGNNTVV